MKPEKQPYGKALPGVNKGGVRVTHGHAGSVVEIGNLQIRIQATMRGEVSTSDGQRASSQQICAGNGVVPSFLLSVFTDRMFATQWLNLNSGACRSFPTAPIVTSFLFDRASQQLLLQSADDESVASDDSECPYCQRPLPEGCNAGRETRGSRAPATQAGFVNPEYFRLLDTRLPSSPDRSGPPSPRRRLVQPSYPAQPESVSTGSSYSSTVPVTSGISSAAFSQGYFKRFFVEQGVLGRGGKGVVLLVNHVLDGVSLGEYACKRVPVGDDHDWLKKVLIEVQLLQRLSHQNLVSYRHVWLENMKLSNFGPSVPCAFILQQYCNSGDLQKYICGSVQPAATPQQLKDRIRRRSKGEPDPPCFDGPLKLPFEEIYSFFRDIASGLSFLHENGYIHRDLKPSNCLLHDIGRELRVLVSDFGEVQSENTIRNSTGSTGTVSYCAPEVLRREGPDGPFGNFTFKSDVFSLGMILYFLCFAQLPYRNADAVDEDKEDLDQLRDEISQWTGFDDARRMRPELPEKLYSFLRRLLSVDPNQRPTAEEVLNGIKASAGGSDSRRFHRHSASSTELRANSLAFSVETSTNASDSRKSSRVLTPRIVPSRQSPDYRSNSTSKNRHPSEPNPDRIDQRRPSENTLLISPPPMSPKRTAIYPIPDHHRIHAANHLLLPPPTRFSLGTLFRHRVSRPYVAITVAFLKILSVTQPCVPLAVNPWIFYPLLTLAAADLGTTRTWFHIFTLMVHILVVFIASLRGSFCVKLADGLKDFR
ncbi:putative serine/threonine-protein kinase iks1 [Emydomyces testavorans]|uniref:non-specific serine/threonine protein kinase n=1 Tax=Emydomyces testavorans TaxID=2070801 RepID=A0AAF0IM76_9EURO|nr:putative serine/threonine-protein kinase iks1 [Emydomyces testavorans]